jgi:hypothetical protein
MSVTVTIGGSSVNRVTSVNYAGKDEEELGTATVEAANTSANRAFDYGEEVVIQRGGTTEFVGVLEKKPAAGGRNLSIELIARDKRAALHYEEVHRPFYEQDSGAVVREAVSQRTKPRNPVVVFDGDSEGSWSSSVPNFRAADIPSQKLYERGGDVLVAYFREEDSGTYRATLDPIPSNAAPSKALLWFETRFMFNNAGDYFRGEIELRDDGGTSYVWDMDIPDTGEAVTRRYPAEEAASDGAELSGSNTLEFRFEIDGNLPEPRAGYLDFGRTRPFGLVSRDAEVSAPSSTVLDSGRDITRRFDLTMMELVQKLSVEDGATSFVDTNDRLHYEPAGDESAPEAIDYASTRVVDAEFHRDSTDIVNRVTVQGAGDRQVQLQSSGSIAFYGVAPRDKPLVEKEIQNRGELVAYGEGFLNDNAWTDTAMSFTIADAAYRAIEIGQEIDISWPAQNINGTFVVSSKEVGEAGKVTIGVTGSEA